MSGQRAAASGLAQLEVRPYSARFRPQWDDFVAHSKNGTFLFYRDYMDYHRDRFVDHSLLVSAAGATVALLPAHRTGDVLVSHGGLTFGGFIINERMGCPLMLQVFDQVLDALRRDGVNTLIYKTIPYIYHRLPAEEDRYALFRHGASLVRRDVLSVVRPAAHIAYQQRRSRAIKHALEQGVRVGPADDLASFWRILEWNLSTFHGVRPVHGLEEIRLLQARFPEHIRLFGAYLKSDLVAGVVIYETHTVAHAQYVASSEAGRDTHALDLLFHELVTTVYANKPYFDLGTSTEHEGRELNVGLAEFKEGFGARAVVHDFYELRVGD